MNEDKTNLTANHMIEWREGDMPYSTAFGDYYYSKADGRAECEHVFINGNNLKERFTQISSITIGELGFGTGLNFLETVRQLLLINPNGVQLDFHSFEKHPLAKYDMQTAHKCWPELSQYSDLLLQKWPENFSQLEIIQLSDNITLYLHIGDIQETMDKAKFVSDAWYLDGFSPAKNKDMWSLKLMKQLADRTAPFGTLSSYTAAGWVRRNLQDAGFDIQKIRGHAGKRDMIIGQLR